MSEAPFSRHEWVGPHDVVRIHRESLPARSKVDNGGGAVLLRGRRPRPSLIACSTAISRRNGGSAVEADGQLHLVVEGSTFARHSGIDIEGNPFIAAVISVGSPGSVEIHRSLFAMNAAHAVKGIWNGDVGEVQASCTDIYGNQFGDWVGLLLGMDQENGNFSLDPLFCGLDAGDFSVASQSPCLPSNNSCGVLIGALEEGCAPIALRPESWGRIKAAYRGGDAAPSTP